MKLPLDVREFEAYGQRWRAIRQASGPLHPILAAGDAPPAGVLFVDEAGDRRFLPLAARDLPSRRRFSEIRSAELAVLLARATTRW